VEVGGATKPLAFVIVVIGSTPEASTGNFQAPLLINYEQMVGKQVILTDSGFSVRQPLV
jgi:flagellar assembly factor FliW